MTLLLKGIRKAYGQQIVLDGFSHRFEANSVTCVTGRSGCGKTTLLRLIAGLELPDAGTISGRPEGGISMMFQEDRLPPSLSASGCLRCVLKKTPKRESEIARALFALDLDPQARQRVAEYSGGMRRRVALARALLFPSPLVLLDEPFKGLDADSRARAIAFAKPLLCGRTVLIVTHDPKDAPDFDAQVLRLDARTA